MIPIGSTIGVFGSGQLGRMFAIEARKLGYRVRTFSPKSNTPTGQVADAEMTAEYDDIDSVRRFARLVDVVTFEFENVPSKAIEAASELVTVHPRGDILHTTQNRLREKTFLSTNGFPVAAFRHITCSADLKRAAAALGFPCILKTAGFGYDGKGQVKLRSDGDIESAFAALEGTDGVLEAFIEFEKEVSVVCARGQDGEFAHYGVIENEHVNHILDISSTPASVETGAGIGAVEIARTVADKLDYVGTLCVEFFLSAGGNLLVNELAPRPHNSGHLTIEACETSQFEQQVRAVCGLPLGSTALRQPAAMANILGDLWNDGEPDWRAALADERVKLHLYGKSEAKVGRKMGHMTALASTAEEAVEAVRSSRARLNAP
ncbi:MAG: 5-(carboxyamino)imidazole ribonucleotide synthase [Pyrinomonadaceae bacterium]